MVVAGVVWGVGDWLKYPVVLKFIHKKIETKIQLSIVFLLRDFS